MDLLLAAAAAWLLVHGVVPATVRPALVARLGEDGYRGGFSLAALAALTGLILAYRQAPVIPLWTPPPGSGALVVGGVLVAMLLFVLGFAARNPASAAFSGDDATLPTIGVVRITRHPVLVGTALWAAAHLPANGHLAALVLFGTFLVTVVNGILAIERRRRRLLGAAWDDFAARTSRLPFAAILTGRNRLVVSELSGRGVAIGVMLFAAAYHFHQAVLGVPALVP